MTFPFRSMRSLEGLHPSPCPVLLGPARAAHQAPKQGHEPCRAAALSEELRYLPTPTPWSPASLLQRFTAPPSACKHTWAGSARQANSPGNHWGTRLVSGASCSPAVPSARPTPAFRCPRPGPDLCCKELGGSQPCPPTWDPPGGQGGLASCPARGRGSSRRAAGSLPRGGEARSIPRCHDNRGGGREEQGAAPAVLARRRRRQLPHPLPLPLPQRPGPR